MFLQCFCVLILISLSQTFTVEVKLSRGTIIGKREATVSGAKFYYAFYGVPYAETPSGKLRFKDPKPAKKWKTPFDATVSFHGTCAQPHIAQKHAVFGYEDCLYLNIYTPQLRKDEHTKLKPVAIWIHGYAFTSSLSHMFGGDFLLEKDIVFITVTHRIGVFGFLKLDDSSTDENMGLKDIVIAIKWIRKYIKQFGGDKSKITLMGSDSGASFLSLLLLSNAKKLFTKMILQSGSLFSASMFWGDHKLERERLQRNLRKMGYSDLLAASTKDIIEASLKIYTNMELMNLQRPIVPFTPTLEVVSNKSLISITPDIYFTKRGEEDKRILIGFNSQESITEVIPFIHNERYLKYFNPYFKFLVPFSDGCSYNYTTVTYKRVADKIKKRYFTNDINEKSLASFMQYVSDLKKYPIWKFIKAYLGRSKSKLYAYYFNYNGSFNAAKTTALYGSKVKIKGASNGDEICYVLRCEPLLEKYISLNNYTSKRDLLFIDEITTYWAGFIKYGNPTPAFKVSNKTWPHFTLKEKNIFQLDTVTKLIDSQREDEMFSFWNEIYAKYYINGKCHRNTHNEL